MVATPLLIHLPLFVVVLLFPGLVFLSSLLGAIVVLASTLFWICALDLVRRVLETLVIRPLARRRMLRAMGRR
jgi:hypothetical protein